MRSRWSRTSLRGRLVLLVAASTLPLLVLGLVLQYLDYRHNVDATGRQILDLARSLTGQVEQELQRRITALEVLAQSRALQLDDLDAFRDRAVALSKGLFGGENVVLVRADGQLLMTTQAAVGEPLPVRPDMEWTSRVFATGRPGVSDLFRGRISGREVFAVDVPVRDTDGAVVAVLSMSPGAAGFGDILRQQKLPERWVASILDRRGATVARTLNPDQFVGRAATPALLDGLQQQPEGIIENLSREGIPLLSAYSRGERFGWTVAIGVPSAALAAPAIAAAWRTLAAGGVFLLIAGALAWLTAGQVVRPIARLRRLALDGGATARASGTGLPETDDVAAALLEAEEQRRRSELSFRHLFERSPLPKWVYDPETLGFLAVNDAAIETYGYTRREFLAMRVVDVMPPEDAARVEALIKQGQGQRHTKDLHLRTKDGRLIDVETYSHAITFEGSPARVVVILDVTERKSAEEQLRHSQKMEAIGQLTGGMAHDFNNLLAVIMGNLGLLRDGGPDDPDFMFFIDEAYAAARRGAELTQSLLAFARRQPLRPISVDLNELVAGTVALLRRTLGEQIEISIDLDPNVWSVVVDPVRLEAALINLATNARDAMPKGGRLHIATFNQRLDADYAAAQAEVRPGDYAMLVVSDSGSGIPPEVLSRIFEPFFTTKSRGEGTGLGLSMVFGFIKQSGGHINVYSEPGVGTTFRLYLPRDPASAGARAAETDEPLPRGAGESVLVVEDDAALRRVVVRQLGQLGYRVEEAENAVDAIALLERRVPVDVVFTDVVMAGRVDGVDLSRIVATRWPATKIVLTSGFPAAPPYGDRMAASDLPLLTKPYHQADLARVLHATLHATRTGAIA